MTAARAVDQMPLWKHCAGEKVRHTEGADRVRIPGTRRRVINLGEGPCMDCPTCGNRIPFDLKLSYRSLYLGVLGCALRFRWLFECRACHEAWIVKRSLVRELEQAGIPIGFLERDGLLVALTCLALLLLLMRLG